MFFFFKQKTAYEMRISDWSSDVCSSDLTLNTRSTAEFERWLQRIEQELEEASAQGQAVAPYAVNLIVQDTGSPRFVEDLALIRRYKPPLVITSVGQAGDVVRLVHDYGGLVFHDIATLRHASKAIGWGVDGLILLTAGAGGHTGHANAFAIVPQVRRMWGGALLLAGAISDGRSILAAQVLGADFCYMGTGFAATAESLAPPAYNKLMGADRESVVS